MPNRMLRDWTDSEKVNALTVQAERFFVRLIMKADDYGCYYGDTRLLKANLFPLLLDGVREADISRWMAECQKAGLIVLYEAAGKKYLQIQDFRQRLDKAKAKFPLPSDSLLKNNSLTDNNDSKAEVEEELEKEIEEENKEGTPAGVDAPASLEENYKQLPKTKNTVYSFIRQNKPKFIQPYIDLWNFFAAENPVPKLGKINDSRKRRLGVRIREDAFDFPKILQKAKQSQFLLESSWFCFDWIIKNDTNYLKILEGNYDNGKAKQPEKIVSTVPIINALEQRNQAILNS